MTRDQLWQEVKFHLELRGVDDAMTVYKDHGFDAWLAWVYTGFQEPVRYKATEEENLEVLLGFLKSLDPGVMSSAEGVTKVTASTWERRELSACLVRRLQDFKGVLEQARDHLGDYKRVV
jgi:hypothetical protein